MDQEFWRQDQSHQRLLCIAAHLQNFFGSTHSVKGKLLLKSSKHTDFTWALSKGISHQEKTTFLESGSQKHFVCCSRGKKKYIIYEVHMPPIVLHGHLGYLLLTLINFNHMPGKVWDEVTYPFPNFNGCTVEVWEWISNFIPYFIMGVVAYLCCD